MDLKEYSTAETVDVKSIPAEVYDINCSNSYQRIYRAVLRESEQVAVW